MIRTPKLIAEKNLKIITLLTLLLFVLIACSRKNVTPQGKIVNLEELDNLRTRSFSQMDARKNDVQLSIELPKSKFKTTETINVTVSLTNITSADIVVYSMDAMPVFGGTNKIPYGIEFILISEDTGLRIEKDSYLDFPQLMPPSPQVFSILPANSSHILKLSLTGVFQSIPAGNYSIQTLYMNKSDFGAEVNKESESYFVDYDAWIGTMLSNIESFRITP